MPRDRLTLQISLDSATPGPHDRHRGRGTWQRALDGIRIALGEGFRVRVAATIAARPDPARRNRSTRFLDDARHPPRRPAHPRPSPTAASPTSGVALTVETLLPEITVTADGVYWHPVAADHADQFVTRDLFPFAAAIDEVQRRFTEYRHTAATAAERFPCA